MWLSKLKFSSRMFFIDQQYEKSCFGPKSILMNLKRLDFRGNRKLFLQIHQIYFWSFVNLKTKFNIFTKSCYVITEIQDITIAHQVSRIFRPLSSLSWSWTVFYPNLTPVRPPTPLLQKSKLRPWHQVSKQLDIGFNLIN